MHMSKLKDLRWTATNIQKFYIGIDILPTHEQGWAIFFFKIAIVDCHNQTSHSEF